MVKVVFENKEYAYIPKKSCWVSSINQVVTSPQKADSLKEIAVQAGYNDVDFVRPPSDLDKYIDMISSYQDEAGIEDELESKIEKAREVKVRVSSEPKKKKEKNVRLKSNSAVSLMGLLKSKE